MPALSAFSSSNAARIAALQAPAARIASSPSSAVPARSRRRPELGGSTDSSARQDQVNSPDRENASCPRMRPAVSAQTCRPKALEQRFTVCNPGSNTTSASSTLSSTLPLGRICRTEQIRRVDAGPLTQGPGLFGSITTKEQGSRTRRCSRSRSTPLHRESRWTSRPPGPCRCRSSS